MEEETSHEKEGGGKPLPGADLLRLNRELQDEAVQLLARSTEILHTMARKDSAEGAERAERRGTANRIEDAAARSASLSISADQGRDGDTHTRAAKWDPFRVAFNDALRPLNNAGLIQATATRLLRRHLSASRAVYGEWVPGSDAQAMIPDGLGDSSSLPPRMPASLYDPADLENLRAGQPVVVDDLTIRASDSERESAWKSLSAGAYIAVPVLEYGKLAATLVVTQFKPRAWMGDEIAITTETANRIWNAVERARAQQALRESEERQRFALEAGCMGSWDLDRLSGRLIWNAQHFRLIGLEPEGHSDWSVNDYLRYVHPDDREAVRRWQGAVGEPGRNSLEYRIVRPDKTVRWMSDFGQTVGREEGWRTRVTGVTSDITERRESEALLASTQERLRLVVDSAHEHAIISLDLERRVTGWNVGAERITGYSAAEMVGQRIDVMFLPEARAAGLPEMESRQALAEGRAGGSNWQVRKDGRRFWAKCALMPMRARTGGVVVGFVKILTDETEMQEAREALERGREELIRALENAEYARAEAEAASRAKDDFLAVLSHELRTPLTPIVMALNALSRRKDLPEPVRTAHEMIERNVQLEAHFIDDMLDVTRIVRGKMEIVRADMDLHDAARRAVEVSAADLEAKGQTLTLRFDASAHWVSGDFARLQQAMWNLLKNASKFTPEGGTIDLRSRNEPGRAVVEITDSGIGMEADVVSRIFNPFEQANPSVAKLFGGLGLGLAIARATVEAHGGELRASSPGPGRGATFTLSLPLAGGEG